MDWIIPLAFVTFKLAVFGVGMFFAIRWHYERGLKERKMDKRAVLRAGGVVAAVFTLALLGLGLFIFFTSRMLGLDLTLP